MNNNINTTQQVPVVETPPVPVVPPASSKMNLFFENLKTKFNSFSKRTKILVIGIGALFLVILLLSILVGLLGKKKVASQATPSSTPIAETPIPNVILNASRYATDSGVLKIESDLQSLGKQLDSLDVKQSDLSLPNLDFKIDFGQ